MHTSKHSACAGVGSGSGIDCTSTLADSQSCSRTRRCTSSEASSRTAKEGTLLRQSSARSRLTEHLASMLTAVEEPMQSALSSLEQADADLAQLLSGIRAEVASWVEKAADMLTTYMSVARELSSSVLPNLQHATSKGKRHAASSLIGVAQAHIDAMKCDGAKVLGSYIILRDRVKYLVLCTELALDCELMCTDGRCRAQAGTSCLESASSDLEKVLAAMDPSAEFWQGFFCTGEALSKMAKDAQSLRNQLCNHHSSAFPAAYPDFCEALLEFCRDHCAVQDCSPPAADERLLR